MGVVISRRERSGLFCWVHGFVFNGGRGFGLALAGMAGVAECGEFTRDVRELVWKVRRVAEVVVVAEIGWQR